MAFEIEEVLRDMAGAITKVVKDDGGDIKQYAEQIMENEKSSLEELGRARLSGKIDEEEFFREIEREKKVVETELLAVEIMTKALAQKAVNAALSVFTRAVEVALGIVR